MNFLLDLFPLILFFAAFKLYNIYVATAVAIAASVVQVGWYRWRHRRFEATQLATLAIIVVLGGLTLALHNDAFIKWKPTLVYWLFAALLFGSRLLGGRPLIERLLGAKVELPAAVWARQNLSWGLFFLFLGALNLYVAFYYGPDLSEQARLDTWVKFKFVMLGLTVAFTFVQAWLMSRHMVEKAAADET